MFAALRLRFRLRAQFGPEDGHEEIVQGRVQRNVGPGGQLGARAERRRFKQAWIPGGFNGGCWHGGVAPAPVITPLRPKKSPSGVAPEGLKSF